MPETQTVTFNYTGSVQTWTVPNGVRQVTIDCYGAEGGRSNYSFRSPGKGGRARATFQVTPGETLYIYVGGRGEFRAPGGWNGGGQPAREGSSYDGSGGGGASDVRRGGNTLNHRIIVAGGGGGAGAGSILSDGGHGGGLVGESGKLSRSPHSSAGGGGTQTAGGAGGRGTINGLSGSFGYGGDVPPGLSSGAGGGGWYGGGSGASDDGYFAGGGGSGYIAPEGINPYFETGVRSGHGLIVIQYEIIPPLYVRVNGQLRESESIHVRVNGQLREVDRIWTRVNGQLREV